MKMSVMHIDNKHLNVIKWVPTNKQQFAGQRILSIAQGVIVNLSATSLECIESVCCNTRGSIATTTGNVALDEDNRIRVEMQFDCTHKIWLIFGVSIL